MRLPTLPSRRRPAEPKPARRPGARGGSGAGGGQARYVAAPREAVGTTAQVPGLYPWSVGSSAPSIGVPLGRRIPAPGSPGGGTVSCDPISWFMRAHLIGNPSAFVLAKPGLGKSTLVRRWVVGLDDYGYVPLALGDTKGEYADVIAGIGGHVAPIGRGRGYLNVLDRTAALTAVKRILTAADQWTEKINTVTDEAEAAAVEAHVKKLHETAGQVLEDSHARRATILAGLLTIMRKTRPSDGEEAILDRALSVLDRTFGDRPPLIGDLRDVIEAALPEVRQVAVDRGDLDYYRQLTRDLEVSLTALITSGRFGGLFSEHTSDNARLRMDRPGVYDVSAIPRTEKDLVAAALLAGWSEGVGNINIAHALADVGLEPMRIYFLILDELWRILRAGHGMPELIDDATRLNRNDGYGQVMITHTVKDLELPDPADAAMARGFIERAGMVICGGLPGNEVDKLDALVTLSSVERRMLTSWTTPPTWDTAAGQLTAPPGRGNFLILAGDLSVPTHVDLAPEEVDWNNTNKRWAA